MFIAINGFLVEKGYRRAVSIAIDRIDAIHEEVARNDLPISERRIPCSVVLLSSGKEIQAIETRAEILALIDQAEEDAIRNQLTILQGAEIIEGSENAARV